MSIVGGARSVGRRFVDQPVTLVLDPLDPDDTRALYVQIGDRIRASICDGRLPQSKPIPVIVVIARRYGVDPRTVRQATQLLAGEGLLRTRSAIGTFVCGMPSPEPDGLH
jgi:DNA-binding GntR family transcriptional regulator